MEADYANRRNKLVEESKSRGSSCCERVKGDHWSKCLWTRIGKKHLESH